MINRTGGGCGELADDEAEAMMTGYMKCVYADLDAYMYKYVQGNCETVCRIVEREIRENKCRRQARQHGASKTVKVCCSSEVG